MLDCSQHLPLVGLSAGAAVGYEVEGDAELLGEGLESLVVAHYGLDIGLQLTAVVSQKQVAETVRLSCGQHHDIALPQPATFSLPKVDDLSRVCVS